MRAAGVAAEIAKLQGSEVIVLHGREKEISPGKGAVAFDVETPQEASEIADEALRTLKDAGVSARSIVGSVIHGRLPRAMEELVKSEDIGLIVMGTRGLSNWGALFLGSATHRVLQLVEVPVLVVP
jgi:nucleotide-binding universal stress UspA family protein